MYTSVIQESVRDMFKYEGSQELAELFDYFFESGDVEAFDIITQLMEPYFEHNLPLFEGIDTNQDVTFDELFDGICYAYVDMGGTLTEGRMKEVGQKVWTALNKQRSVATPFKAIASKAKSIYGTMQANKMAKKVGSDKVSKTSIGSRLAEKGSKLKSFFKEKLGINKRNFRKDVDKQNLAKTDQGKLAAEWHRRDLPTRRRSAEAADERRSMQESTSTWLGRRLF